MANPVRKEILLPIHDPQDLTSLDTAVPLCHKCDVALRILYVHGKDEGEVPLRDLRLMQEKAEEEGIDSELQVSFGKPIKEILKAVQHNTSLVILKYHTAINTLGSGLFRMSTLKKLTSPEHVTREVLKRISIPTLITFGIVSPMRRPLIAYHDSFAAKTALRNVLLLMANKVFRKGVVLYAGEPGGKADDVIAEAEQLGRDFNIPLASEIVSKHQKAEIADAARRLQCDLIVMGSYGRTWLKRSAFGSALEGVFADATVPVFLG